MSAERIAGGTDASVAPNVDDLMARLNEAMLNVEDDDLSRLLMDALLFVRRTLTESDENSRSLARVSETVSISGCPLGCTPQWSSADCAQHGVTAAGRGQTCIYWPELCRHEQYHWDPSRPADEQPRADQGRSQHEPTTTMWSFGPTSWSPKCSCGWVGGAMAPRSAAEREAKKHAKQATADASSPTSRRGDSAASPE